MGRFRLRACRHAVEQVNEAERECGREVGGKLRKYVTNHVNAIIHIAQPRMD